jgi:dephospho-CoA kinase
MNSFRSDRGIDRVKVVWVDRSIFIEALVKRNNLAANNLQISRVG